MKKILHIPNYYPPHTGGIEDVCYNIVNYLISVDNVEQRVICFNDSDLTILDKYEGIEVMRVGAFKKIASQALSISYKKDLKKLIHDFKPDVIHFHAPNPLIAYYLLSSLSGNIRLIVHWHSDIVAQKMLYYFIKPIETRLLKRADIILATSPNYVLGSKSLQKFKGKVDVLPNIIKPKKFDYTERVKNKVMQIKDSYNNKPIVLFIGRHVPYKGLQYLLEAASKITSKCEIVIGGQGPLTGQLKRINKVSNIHFVGRIPDEELTAYYYAADLFVFPSITKNEAFGVVLAEAMYCNTPAVTFTIKGSGVNWVNLDGVTGLEVPNSDVIKLADAIDRLLGNNPLREKFAKQARERVESLFTVTRISDDLKKLYV
ncbi:MAG: glycosyltransferase [Odoribacter sp.]